jgi:cytochrome o ubiquinol oxidase subunit III
MSEEDDTKIFGFWLYLMTDLIIFTVLFAAFVVLKNGTSGGPTSRELFHLPTALAETLLLLVSSFTCALGIYEIHRENKRPALFYFFITFLLGLSFLYIELKEFHDFIAMGASWRRSAFLSSFFTLVGTHGLHISIGLLWMIVAMCRIVCRPLTASSISRIWRMGMFWHFLDVVWIFIFTIVYMMGHLL